MDQVMNFKVINYPCSSQKMEHFLEQYLAGWLISINTSSTVHYMYVIHDKICNNNNN